MINLCFILTVCGIFVDFYPWFGEMNAQAGSNQAFIIILKIINIDYLKI